MYRTRFQIIMDPYNSLGKGYKALCSQINTLSNMSKPILTYGNSSAFNAWYNDTKTVIKQHHSWNAEDHFIATVEGLFAPSLKHGEVTTCVDLHGRRLVIAGTLLGNVVVYDKHPRSNAISMNANKKVLDAYSGILFRGAQTEQTLKIIIGSKVFPSLADRIKFIKETK